MPWGKKSTDHDISGLSKKDKQTYNRTVANTNQAAKNRLQTKRKAQSNDGNRGKR